MATNIGTTVYLATGVPATFDQVGYEALTWVEIENILEVGSFSTADSMIDIPNLKTGLTKGVKGMRQGNDVEMMFEGDATATGQAAVRTACLDNSGQEYSLRVIGPDGSKTECASGVMHSFVKNPRTGDSYEGASFQLRQNYVEVAYAL